MSRIVIPINNAKKSFDKYFKSRAKNPKDYTGIPIENGYTHIRTGYWSSIWGIKKYYDRDAEEALKEGRATLGRPTLKVDDILLVDQKTCRYIIKRKIK